MVHIMEKKSLECKQSNFLNCKEVENITESLLSMAKSNGATSCEVAVNFDKGLSVTTRLGEVETVEFNQDKNFSITVYFGQRRGSATSSDTTISSLKQLVDRACDIAKVSDEDLCFGLAEERLLAKDFPELKLQYDWQLEVEEAVESAKQCELMALDLDSKIVNSDGSNVSSYQFLCAYANSTGFNHSFTASRHSKSCILLAKDLEGLKRDYDYTTARDPSQLVDNKILAEQAVARTISRMNPQKLTSRSCPVIFSNEVSSSLLGAFISAISGGSLYRRSSFLLDSIGKQIFPKRYNIEESPYNIGALGSSAYDGEGVQTRNNRFIEEGIIQQYVLGSYSARRLGLETTANAGGVHNLSINDDGCTEQELLQEMGTGLLVTSLMGSAVNMVTGDYSRGASGFWIENGQRQYPVEEITIASNFLDMFSSIQMIANNIDIRKSTKCGSILIPKMTIAGK